LRVFQPRTSLVKTEGFPSEPSSFRELDIAFQNATGWELSWNPYRRSSKTGRTASGKERARHDWIRISDLSGRLPPGIPAASRIYCENLILRLNRLISELKPADETKDAASGNQATSLAPCTSPDPLEPCYLNSASIVPLPLQTRENRPPCGFQWVMREDGSIMTAAFVAGGSSERHHAGILSAKASFLVAARLGGDCASVAGHIRTAIEQLFCGDVQVHLVVWTLNPLLGFASICGDACFQLYLDQQPLLFEDQRTSGFLWMRGQNLVLAGGYPCNVGTDEDRKSWFRTVSDVSNRHSPSQWQTAILQRLQQVIPRLDYSPEAALVMERH
jgi:hypothetical protein